MKIFLKSIILIIFSFASLYATNGQNYYRYGDINTKLNKRALVEIAKGEVRRLVIQKKLPPSWKDADFNSINKTNTNNNIWVVSFKNKKIKKTKHQILYIFVSNYGNIKGANYSGR